MKPKQLDEWDLEKAAKKEVKKQIRVWIKHFTKHADERVGTVRHLDFKNDDVFFFTDCKDIQDKGDPNEHSKIKHRKRNVFHELFLKYLINDKIKIEKPVCKKCGHDSIDSISVGNTYMTVCPNCGNLLLRGDIKEFAQNANAVMRLAMEGGLDKYDR